MLKTTIFLYLLSYKTYLVQKQLTNRGLDGYSENYVF